MDTTIVSALPSTTTHIPESQQLGFRLDSIYIIAPVPPIETTHISESMFDLARSTTTHIPESQQISLMRDTMNFIEPTTPIVIDPPPETQPHSSMMDSMDFIFPFAPTTTTVPNPASQHHTPTHPVPDSELYKWVNSFYGPGTVGSWLLILCSVLISWTLHPHQRKKDHITNDFTAALMFPFIASVHLTFLLSQLPVPLSDVLTSPDLEMLQRTAALAAPLNICEVFPTLALLLFTIAAWRRHVKRAVLTFGGGVLSWCTVNLFYFSSRDQHTKQREADHQTISTRVNPFIIIGWMLNFMVVLPPVLIIGYTRMGRGLKGTAVLSGLSAVVALAIAILVSSGMLDGSTPRSGDGGGGIMVKPQPLFIPRTYISLRSLDQIVALCGGCITLLFSLLEAYRARRYLKLKAKLKAAKRRVRVVNAPRWRENTLGWGGFMGGRVDGCL